MYLTKQKNTEQKVNKFPFLNFRNNRLLILIAFLSIFSCKTTEISTSKNSIYKNASVKEVIGLHKTVDFKFNTLQSNLKVNYDDGKRAVSPSVTLRMEKDKQILLSAKILGFTVAKVYITPTRVSFYEKLNKRYYDGDFKALSKFLGQEVDFQKVQNLLLGQSILDTSKGSFQSNFKAPNNFLITPKKQNKTFDIALLINQLNLKVANYDLRKKNSSGYLTIDYPNYQKVSDQDFPKNVVIKTLSKSKKKNIEINYKSVETDIKLSFPYTIPQGYKSFTLN